MKKGVIFDLDGTLINSLPDIADSMNAALQRAGLPVFPEDAYKYKTGDGVINLTKRSIGSHTECFDQVLKTYMEIYAAHCTDRTYVYPGVAELLEELLRRSMKICVFTNKDQADAENVLARLFPSIRFSAIQGRVPDLPIKPDPSGALRMTEQLGLAREEIWYVGDTATDIRCGNAAGFDTVGVLWGYRPREELTGNGAKELIAEPMELLRLTDKE